VKKEPRYNAPPSRTEIPIFISHPKASFYLMVEGKMAKSLNEWGWIVIFFYFVSPLTRQLEAAISSQLEVNLTLEQDGMVPTLTPHVSPSSDNWAFFICWLPIRLFPSIYYDPCQSLFPYFASFVLQKFQNNKRRSQKVIQSNTWPIFLFI
jgi:hypothetical protein